MRYALRDVLPFAALAALAMAAGWAVSQLANGNIYISLLLKVVTAVVVYAGSLRLLGAQIFAECTAFIKSKLGHKATP